MGADVGGWLVLLSVAGGTVLAWKAWVRARHSRGGRRAAAAVSLALSAFFFHAWYERYLKWDFNELGRYFDPVDQTVYTTAGSVWVLPASLFLIIGLRWAWQGWRSPGSSK